jgi:hypothetical protein
VRAGSKLSSRHLLAQREQVQQDELEVSGVEKELTKMVVDRAQGGHCRALCFGGWCSSMEQPSRSSSLIEHDLSENRVPLFRIMLERTCIASSGRDKALA